MSKNVFRRCCTLPCIFPIDDLLRKGWGIEQIRATSTRRCEGTVQLLYEADMTLSLLTKFAWSFAAVVFSSIVTPSRSMSEAADLNVSPTSSARSSFAVYMTGG